MPVTPVRILIADDHDIVRRGLRSLLSTRSDLEICGEAENGFEAVEKARRLVPDIILLDVSMPIMNGLEAGRAIRQQVPTTQILLVSQNEPSVLQTQAADIGAHGFVTKSHLSRQLLKAIDQLISQMPPSSEPVANAARPLLSSSAESADEPDMTWLNRRLRDMLMKAPSAIGITVGPEHRWAYVNLARARMAGRVGPEDFIGRVVRDSYPELEGQPFFAALDQAYQTGIPFVGREVKATFNRGPGKTPDEAYVDCVYQPIKNAHGKIEGLLIHTVEVTEQVLARRAVEAAHESEKQQRLLIEFERNQLREVFERAPAAIAILTGPEHRWTFLNPAYTEIVGRPAEKLLTRSIRETLPELAGQGIFELLDEVYSSGKPYIGNSLKAVLNRGANNVAEEAYFDFVYHPMRNVAGEVESVMVFAVDVTRQAIERNELEARVRERTTELRLIHETLRVLSARIMQAQDDERRKFARELHDSAGQYLAALSMNLSALSNSSSQLPEPLTSLLHDSIELVDRCTTEIRTMSYLLHPPLLDDMGLASAISWYTDGFSKRSGISVTLDIPKTPVRYPAEIETALFRIVQQSLANIHRHSGSKVARITLAQTNGRLLAEVADEGEGLPADILTALDQNKPLPGVGISGMRERINSLGGNLTITSTPKGTTLKVSIPINSSK